MLWLRAALQLFPTKFKDKLKQNPRLTTLYIKAVRRAGLFFDAPTPKQTRLLYSQWIEFKESSTNSSHQNRPHWQAVIFGSGIESTTRRNVEKLGAICYEVKESKNWSYIIDSLDDSLPTLLLNQGDSLDSNAISFLFDEYEGYHFVYCDTDTINAQGVRVDPRFLPDWSPDLIYSTGYVRTGVIIDTSLLRLVKVSMGESIAQIISELSFIHSNLLVNHVPLPLVHQQPNSSIDLVVLNGIKEVLENYSETTVRLDENFKVNRICWKSRNPLVTLIIPTKNGKELVKACIESILSKTTYRNFEILLIDNNSDETDSLEYFAALDSLSNVTVLKYAAPFNYSAINNFGVAHARGEIIGLINNDIEVITPDWLTYMVGHVERESIGCVGAKLLYSDSRIQHAGVVLGYGGGAGHAHKNFPRCHSGYLSRIAASGNYSALTGACLLVKRVDFNAVGGLNEKELAVAFNDVDFCLKVQKLGKSNVYCAEAELYHHESVSRGLDVSPEKAARFKKELSYLQSTWNEIIAHDPAYSPNLTLKRENFAVKSEAELKNIE